MVNYMIIEDEYYSSEELKSILKGSRSDYNLVCSAEDVESSISFLKENDVDLIFSDIRLSDGTCFDVFDVIGRQIPTIFISGYKEYSRQATFLKCIDFILKPYSEQALISAIEKFEEKSSR